MSEAGVKRILLKDLCIDSSNILIVGIIIAKRSSRTFLSKKDGSDRGVWSFTFRDSPADYINVTAWGTPDLVEKLSNTYRVGDVIDLTNVRVTLRRLTDREDNFQPPVTSCFELSFNEGLSEICLHDEDDILEFKKLLRLPTKPPSNFVTLADVKTSSTSISGQFVNLLFALQKVAEVKEVKTKDGRRKQVLILTVMDQSSSGFTIQCWEQDTIARAKSWKPKDTVLFVSDVRMGWDGFRRAMTGTIGDKAVVTEMPKTKEASILSVYVKSVAPQNYDDLDESSNLTLPPTEQINNVMSCHAVAAKAYTDDTLEHFTALIYATIESFDLDGEASVISTRCGHCGSVTDDVCVNGDCPSMGEAARITAVFRMKLSLADHTGRLDGCRLNGNTAANLLQTSTEEWELMSEAERVQFKWKYLLKFGAVRVVVRPPNPSWPSPSITVLDLRLVSLEEFAMKTPVY